MPKLPAPLASAWLSVKVLSLTVSVAPPKLSRAPPTLPPKKEPPPPPSAQVYPETESEESAEEHRETYRKKVGEMIQKRFGAERGLVVQTREQLQDYINGAVEQLYSIAYGQQIVVMLVAALGVVMAFLISVLQRRREMGLLRAIGASQAQVVTSVLVEAVLMGLIGTAIGLVVGIPMEWFVLNVAILEESGYYFPMHIPWGEALVIAASALTAPVNV